MWIFIWDFVSSVVLNEILDWTYTQIIGFLSDFFANMGHMGAELFEMSWVQGIVLFFSRFGWALYVVGLVVSAFEVGIEFNTGRGNIKETAMSALKGFIAVSLFTTVPVRLYELSITLQGLLTRGLTGAGEDISTVGQSIMDDFSSLGSLEEAASSNPFGLGVMASQLMLIVCLILMAYAVIKVFLENLKRGGILLIQIAVGSLYMFSIPRGYADGFMQWIKQVIGLCLTAFLQSTMLVAGLLTFKSNALLGIGLMLAAGEVPRIAGNFGLDTSTRANLSSAVFTAQSAINVTKTIAAAAA